jgi:uracil-DNA glycosylase
VIGGQRRRRYLAAMGIELWEQRPAGAATPAAEAPGAGAPLAADLPPDGGPEDEVAQLDWDALQARVLACTRCRLAESRTQAVFGVGNRHAEWMIVGEAPGAEEDRRGEPFVGRAGQLLNEMLHAIGLQRGDVYIANVVKSRPPNNREPLPDEVAACKPYLRRQIELVQPRIILSVGRVSAQNLLETKSNIGALRGRRFDYEQTRIPVVVTYHPAYLLRSPSEKHKAWQDLLLARRIFAGEAP